MGRRQLAVVACAAISHAACGDPLVVIGDAPGIVRIVAGIPDEAGDSLGARATESQLFAPRGLAADADGFLYIADHENGRVLAVSSSGAIQVLVDHSRRTREPRLQKPDGLALDGRGGLFITDPAGHRVWHLALTAGELTPVAGTGQRGFSPDTAAALTADLDTPTGIAVDEDGAVYFSELFSHRVRRLEADGTIVTVAGDGIAGAGGDGGLATRARLRRPTGLAVASGALYIADSGNQRVRVVSLERSIIETIAGRGLAGFGGDGGEAGEALLDDPSALAVSSDGGTLFIADSDNHRIRSVNLRTMTITTFAGSGEADFKGDLLTAAETALSAPQGLSVSPFGLLYIADTGHHMVRRTAIRFVSTR